MKTKSLKLLGCAVLSCLFAFVSQAQSVSSTPVGYVTQTINAGTGTARLFTTFALPLYSPSASGTVTSVAGNVVTSDDASFGALSEVATPYSLKVVSGTLSGKYFPITANSATTVTVTGDLTGLSADDSYEIVEVDTLSSLFGTPSDGVIVGGTKSEADIIWVLTSAGTWSNYYFNTASSAWVRDARGNPNSDNLAIQPDSGILIQRLSSTSSSFVITGTVPSVQNVASINAAGFTVWAQTFPTDITLANSGIQNAAEFSSSDLVYIMTAAGTWATYSYDGTNWRKNARGNPISDGEAIASGSAVLISKASAASSDSNVTSALPYTL
jgi:uncharacterized protein (TIGR02597 family)